MSFKSWLSAACAFAAAACAAAERRGDDIVVENARFRLVIGADATAKSLVAKGSGEELLDMRDPTPFFSVTQERPFNNEIKLAHPNTRTTYPANSVRREGGRLVVGFEIAPYEAVVSVRVAERGRSSSTSAAARRLFPSRA